ncbi:primosomal protein N' [Aquimarina sp. ERC-38]|uniref:replication restart helicase PriA n=1 Tax=Aquimarina sp. ERC-38 TaxID=2949996 RepID=UPI002245EDAF|nr:primosomal protein N' [Aquimarina sp. ERC-38]UZO80071.1 primosomal protein N' [Aquimarina sp. ERC-38]
MSYYIDVILPIPLENQFTYAISQAEAAFVKPGMRVAVPFGKKKLYAGLIASVHQNRPLVYEAKDIEHILDEEVLVTQAQLQLWSWIASYYMCTLGEVMRAALPSSFLLESETLIVKSEHKDIDAHELTDQEYLVYEALQHQSMLKINELVEITGRKNVLPLINSMIEKGVLHTKEEIYEVYVPKKVKYLQLSAHLDNNEELEKALTSLKRANRQKEALLNLYQAKAKQKDILPLQKFLAETGTTTSVINSLKEKGLVTVSEEQEDRQSYKGATESQPNALNEEQKKALDVVKQEFTQKNVCLLYGVTASGKTEVYVQLIKSYLDQGKQVLYLLPEIGLTTQLIQRLEQYFGSYITVYHSRFTGNERVEAWRNVQNHKKKGSLIIGARSSIFLPFKNLGLIIIDEEHEHSFKQFDPAPRYHARDTAIVLASFFQAKVVLGSATPAVETFYNVQQNKYGLASLTRRYQNVQMPEIQIVDLKEKYKKKLMKDHFSDILLTHVQEALANKEQVILFQNRRGFAPVVECTTCGHVPQCSNCDVSLTYHQQRNQLRCHYCGYHMAMPHTCLACGSPDISTKGFGTEQIEKELLQFIPDTKVGRMDQDTTRGKHGYEKIINKFENNEIDVLVGTQMLTKGLDFRNVSLVGIMNADNLLNYPDFRAHERSFQLLLQVAGRAGRTKKQGKVLVQTYNPYHQIIQQVSVNNYQGMYKDQIEERKQYLYPPFYKLIRFTGKHKDFSRVNEATEWFAKSLRMYFGENVLGPEFPPVARIRNQYQKNIILKISAGQSLQKTKEAIAKILKTFKSVRNFSGVRMLVDVDPY